MGDQPWSAALRRRRFLTVAAGAGIGAALGGCGLNGASGSAGSGPPVEFTDARGKRVRTEHTPRRVVAYVGTAAALWDFGFRCVGIFGQSTTSRGRTAEAGNLDLSAVTSLGQQFEQFDQERYVRLNPDLLLCPTYDGKTLWGIPSAAVGKIEELAPTAAVHGVFTDLTDLITETGRLAGMFGADQNAPPIVRARRRFDAANERLATLARRKKGLRLLFASPWQNNFYVNNPAAIPELRHLSSLGLDIVEPSSGGRTIFEAHSWEEPGVYPADVILHDSRPTSMTLDQLKAFPTWQNLPAVRAGQLHPFSPQSPFSYQIHAENLTRLADALERFDPSVV